MNNIRALILDMDGVIWRDKEPIGNTKEIFEKIRTKDLKIAFATNNSSRSSIQHLEKLISFGVCDVEPWQVVSSCDAVIDYLETSFTQRGSVFVVGEKSLENILVENGYQVSETNAVAVIAGIDRFLDYKKLNRATQLIRNGAKFIGTNPDKTFPTPEGLAPGAGAILAAIEASTDVAPIIVGKPSSRMYEIALKRLGVKAHETLVVGDRLETDIVGAQNLGCKSALVLSGVTTQLQAAQWSPAPDLIEPDLYSVISKI